jgi:hypothetical protein
MNAQTGGNQHNQVGTRWQGLAQANTQLSRHKQGGTNMSKGRSGVSRGGRGDE